MIETSNSANLDYKQLRATVIASGVIGSLVFTIEAWNAADSQTDNSAVISSLEGANYYLRKSEHTAHQISKLKSLDQRGIRANNQLISSYRAHENTQGFPDTMPVSVAGFSFIAIAAALIASSYSYIRGHEGRALKRQAKKELKEDADIINEFLELEASFSQEAHHKG